MNSQSFNIWDRGLKRTARQLLKQTVEISYRENGNFKNISKIEANETVNCGRCGSTGPMNDAQATCFKCIDIAEEELPEKFKNTVIIQRVSRKKLKFSRVVTFTIKFDNRSIHSESIFERSPLFDAAMLLEEGLSRVVSGWVEDECIEVTSIQSSD
ncbi:hypothetical protein ACHWQZ_G000795 [Mnemiopsis leidyi]